MNKQTNGHKERSVESRQGGSKTLEGRCSNNLEGLVMFRGVEVCSWQHSKVQKKGEKRKEEGWTFLLSTITNNLLFLKAFV